MNYYSRHIGDYLKDTAHLTLLEHGIYARLLDVYYTREAGIADDQAARLIGARTPEEREALACVLEEFFELVEGVWTQKRCEQEIEDARRRIDTARQNGRSGGRPRKKPSGLFEQNPEETQRVFCGFPKQNPDETQTKALQSQSQSQSQELRPRGVSSKTLSSSGPDVPGETSAAGPPEPDRSAAQIVDRVFLHWRETWGHPRAKLDEKRRRRIRDALRLGYSEADLCQAISGYRNSPHHTGQNDRDTVFDDLELLLRDAKHIDAGLRFYAEPPRTNLSAQTRRIIDQTADWVPPELREVKHAIG